VRSRRLTSALSTVAALAVSLTFVTVTAAKGSAGAPSCAMVTADEANAISGRT
jgi:hypothetical protein